MAAKKLFVSNDRGVALKNGSVVGGGTEITEGMIEPDMVQALLRSGHLREGEPGPSPVELYDTPTISAKERSGEDGIKTAPSQPKAKAVPRKWNLTDEQLRGKSLDDLNAMIVERGGKPQANVEDAINMLQAEL